MDKDVYAVIKDGLGNVSAPVKITVTAMLPPNTVSAVATVMVSNDLTISIGTLTATAGSDVVVPIKLSGQLPSSGIDLGRFYVYYDATVLEYKSTSAGSIITNAASNFTYSNNSNVVSLEFSDNTLGSYPIQYKGDFATITFKVIAGTPAGATTLQINNVDFADGELNVITIQSTNGTINIK